MKIPYLNLSKITASFEPELSNNISSCVLSGKYLQDIKNKEFELNFSNYIGTKYCIGVGNGLDALTLILLSLKKIYSWSENTEVVLPAFTFIATAEAVSRVGVKILFCDINPDTFLLETDKLEKIITNKTKAIIPVHLYGVCCNMDEIISFAKKYDLFVIEDAAQAHGATYKKIKAGNWGIAAAFSFYPGKNLGALGDAGAVVTNNKKIADLVRVLSNYGAEKKYYHSYLGINSRLDEIQACVLLTKLQYIERDNLTRKRIASLYFQYIETKYVSLPKYKNMDENVYHIFPLKTLYRIQLKNYLQERGIETQYHYPIPVHKQKAYKNYNQNFYPHSEYCAKTEISIPLNPIMTAREVKYIIKVINKFQPKII